MIFDSHQDENSGKEKIVKLQEIEVNENEKMRRKMRVKRKKLKFYNEQIL